MSAASRSSTPCRDCGEANYWTAYTESCAEKKAMDANGVCFGCAFWRVQITKKHPLVIAGRIYSEGDTRKPPNSPHSGMAGRRFDIEYFDGRRVTTHDLWAGSEVPERYCHLIPDTARFAGGAREAKVGDITCWTPSIAKATGSAQ